MPVSLPMTILKRIVVDNGTLISRLPPPSSVPGMAVRKIVDTAQLLVSEPVRTAFVTGMPFAFWSRLSIVAVSPAVVFQM